MTAPRIGSQRSRWKSDGLGLASSHSHTVGPLGLKRWIPIGVRHDGATWYICRVCGYDSPTRDWTCGQIARSEDWTQDGLPECAAVTEDQLRARGAW